MFPAWAGVIRLAAVRIGSEVSVPRVGGGDPITFAHEIISDKCSPRGRG